MEHSKKKYYRIRYLGNESYKKEELSFVHTRKLKTAYTGELFLAKEFCKLIEHNGTLFAKYTTTVSISYDDELTTWNDDRLDLELDRLTVFVSKANPHYQLITTARMLEDYCRDWIVRCSQKYFCRDLYELLTCSIMPFIKDPSMIHNIASIAELLVDYISMHNSFMTQNEFQSFFCQNQLDIVSLFYFFDFNKGVV